MDQSSFPVSNSNPTAGGFKASATLSMKGTILQFVVVWLLSPWLVHSGLYDVEVLARVALDGGVSCTVVQDVALASGESATSNPVDDGSAAQSIKFRGWPRRRITLVRHGIIVGAPILQV